MVSLLFIAFVLGEMFVGVLSNLDTRSKIIGGIIAGKVIRVKEEIKVVNNGEFPYMAFLEINHKLECGAVIIRLDIVLTAGHCINDDTPPSNLQIRAGTFIRDDKFGKHIQLRDVAKFQKHPLYRTTNIFVDYDIAAIKLKAPFLATNYIKPVNLPEKSQKENFIGEEAVIIGLGEIEYRLEPENLMKATVKILSRKNCQSMLEHIKILDTHICMIGNNGIEAPCNGDSGSPLVKHNPLKPDKDILLGLSSFSTPNNEPLESKCIPSLPAVYTDISALRNWIDHRLMKL